MNGTEQHLRTKELFLEALSKPAQERTSFVEQRTGDDYALCAEVVELLQYSDDGSDYTISGMERSAGLVALEITANRQPAAKYKRGDVFAERYRIVAPIGYGAMGDVYRAFDTVLDVEVALKLLKDPAPALIERLREEVRLAREVTNPVICRVFDVGEFEDEHFLTMEFVEGEDLRSLLSRLGKLSCDDVYSIAIQLCEGLVAAHEHGVLHRDLKPANIIMNSLGSVLIADFGVASTTDGNDHEPMAGTPAYMAPEILTDGEAASPRSDLFALGRLLCELLTGQPPKSIDSSNGATKENLSLKSQAPGIDPRLDRLIGQMIDPDPDRRPRSAKEVLRRLRGPIASPSMRKARIAAGVVSVGAFACAIAILVPSPAGEPDEARDSAVRSAQRIGESLAGAGAAGAALTRIAVITLTDEQVDSSNPTLTAAIRDGVIDALSKGADLGIVPATAIDDYVAGGGKPESVGVELGADYLVHGRIERDGKDLLISVRLTEAKGGRRLWAGLFRRPFEADALSILESDIATQVATSLREHRSLESDTDVAAETDPLVESILVRARVAAVRDWDWNRAEQIYLDALDRNPESTLVLGAYAEFLASQGRFDAAVEHALRAVELDPTSATMLRETAACLYEARSYDRAAAFARLASTLDDTDTEVVELLTRIALERGNYDDAIANAQLLVRLAGRNAATLALLAYTYHRTGDSPRADALAREAVSFGTLGLEPRLLIALATNQLDDAMATLADALEQRHPLALRLEIDPIIDPLRALPSYTRLSIRLDHRGER